MEAPVCQVLFVMKVNFYRTISKGRLVPETAPPVLQRLQQTEDQPVNHAGTDAKDQDRSGDDKQLGRGAGNESFTLKLQRRGNHGVGKARNGYQCPRARVLGQPVNSPSPVNSAARKISTTDTLVPAPLSLIPQVRNKFISPWPAVQISPPVTKAQIRFFPMGEGLDLALTYFPYSLLVISIKGIPPLP